MINNKTVVIATDLEHYLLVQVKDNNQLHYEFPRALNKANENSRQCARRQLQDIASLTYDSMLDGGELDGASLKICLVDFYKQPIYFHATDKMLDYRLITKADLIKLIKSGKLTDKLTLDSYNKTKTIID